MAFAAIVAVATISSVGAQEVQPNLYQTHEIPVGTFDRIVISGPIKAVTFSGPSGGPLIVTGLVSVSGPPALISDVIAEVEDGTLTIRFRDDANWSWNHGSGVNIFVHAPSLVSARVEGAGQLKLYRVQGEVFSAATDGSGTIVLQDIDAGQVMLATGGSGSITAEGTAKEGTYAVGGSGSIDAKRLRVATANVAIGGSGSIYADVSDTANVAVDGSGRVDLVGGANCIKEPSDSKQIECR